MPRTNVCVGEGGRLQYPAMTAMEFGRWRTNVVAALTSGTYYRRGRTNVGF